MKRLDLIHAQAPPRKYSRRQKEVLTFCFARGNAEDDLLEVCAPPLEASSFLTNCFAHDLFLEELIEGGFSIRAQGRRWEAFRPQLKRLILGPPGQASLRLRQAILRELSERDELRQKLENAYFELREFRSALAGADALGGKISHLRRRVEILVGLRKAVVTLGELGRAANSDLSRLADWVGELTASAAYQQLETLLDFEDRRTVLEALLQVGFDGSLRRFEVVRTTQTAHPAFDSNRLSRFFRRLFSLLRGYRFSDEDVMSQLLDRVFSELEQEVVELVGCSLDLELYLSALGFRAVCRERGYAVCLPEFGETGSAGRAFVGLFNPWLLAQGVDAVCCNQETQPAQVTLIVTGPNSGGKTRYLQAVAVTQLLGQVGVFVPAEQARLVWVRQLFLSLLEHVDAAQSEGRLGMELMRIRRVFETSGRSSLIIMDELCSGTNPSEGEQIFEMVLELFEELKPQVIISTHFLDFAARLESQVRASLKFVQVELGPRDLPTYQFVPGVAKTSLARNTAARLGVTRDELLGLVEQQKTRVGAGSGG